MIAALRFRVLVAPLVGAMLVAGVWVAGGLITDDFKTSVALTTAWFVLGGSACAALAYAVRDLRVPVAVGYLATVAVVGGYLGWATLHDTVVHERVVVGVRRGHATAVSTPGAGTAATPTAARPARPVELAAGVFASGEHSTTGKAAIVRLPDGRLVLTLTRFRTSPGPDLRVRLAPGGADRGDAPGNRDLGVLKGNIGDQQYDIPRRTPVTHTSVVIWCRAFSATFGTAELARS